MAVFFGRRGIAAVVFLLAVANPSVCRAGVEYYGKWWCFWCPSTEEIRQTVIEAVRSEGDARSKLVAYTVEDTSRRVETVRDRNWFKNLLFGQEVEALLLTTVHLGIDLGGLSKESITIENGKINISLPAIEVVATELNLSKSMVDPKKKGLFVSCEDQIELVQYMFGKHKNDIEKEILDDESIRKKTSDQIKKILKRIILFKFFEDNVGVNFLGM